jgi:hypothetical protein
MIGLHECDNCISGTVPEVEELDGGCVSEAEDILAVKKADSVDECFILCSELSTCESYSWWDNTTWFSNDCFLYAGISIFQIETNTWHFLGKIL